MGCQVTKCSTVNCEVRKKACQLINGKCPACYEKEKQQSLNNLKKP